MPPAILFRTFRAARCCDTITVTEVMRIVTYITVLQCFNARQCCFAQIDLLGHRGKQVCLLRLAQLGCSR